MVRMPERIRGLKIVHPDNPPRDAVAYDARFVDFIWDGSEPFLPFLRHGIALYYFPPILLGVMNLYGSGQFVVRLVELEEYPEQLYIHEFAEDGSSNHPLTPPEIVERFQKLRNPRNTK